MEAEMWNIVKEVSNPKSAAQWELKINENENTTDHQKIADTFNQFFSEKIANLQSNIDPKMAEDPTKRLKEKWNSKPNRKTFKLKEVDIDITSKSIKKMHKKKSECSDGLTQEQLILGSSILKVPLTNIINCSIREGIFPDSWKEAYVTPVLKKGDRLVKENYRPVSCLPAASKLLELIVCQQTTHFVETEGILPPNQHGFRAKHSTMSAWADMQNTWSKSTESKDITGILLWDLTAAFDTLDHKILIQKLGIYGFCQKTLNWFESFLKNRSQRCKIEDCLSSLQLRTLNCAVDF